MATVKRSPNGKKWRARWYDPSGKECAKDFDLKRDANRHANDMEASKARGVYIDPSDRTTVSAYARQWAESRPHNERTRRRVASALKNHVDATTLGAMPLSRVLQSTAQGWATGRSKVLSRSTLAYTVHIVGSIFKAAAADRKIPSSPFVGISLPEATHERIVPLVVAQVRKLADAMPDRNRAMVITQAGLGLRIGELLALRVEDVRFLKREVRIEFQIPPDGTEREAPKTPLSRRTLPLPAFVGEALAEHMRDFPPPADGTIFPSDRRATYSTTTYATIFRKAAARAGLPKGTTSHDLRHHFASVLLFAGESVVAVAERLGHRNANLVITTYGHLLPDSEERTRTALEAAWSDADQVRTSGPSKAV